MTPKTMNSPGYRLRAILLVVYVPTLILCICTAAIIHAVLPTLGLIPCTMSALHSAALIFPVWRKRSQIHLQDEESEEDELFRRWPLKKRAGGLDPTLLNLFCDALISLLLLTVLLCTWTISPWEGRYAYTPNGMIMLATYTTVPMIFCFIAHTWLAILGIGDIYRTLRINRNKPAECPNCHARFRGSTGNIEATQGDRVEDYTISRPSEETTFRDTSFDSDVAIRPEQHETASAVVKGL